MPRKGAFRTVMDVSPDLKAAIDERMEETGRTFTDIIARAVRLYLSLPPDYKPEDRLPEVTSPRMPPESTSRGRGRPRKDEMEMSE